MGPTGSIKLKRGKATIAFVAAAVLVGATVTALWAAVSSIDDYQPYYALCPQSDGGIKVAIRKFRLNGETRLLTVNPYNLHTGVVKPGAFQCREVPLAFIRQHLSGTTYAATVMDAEKNSRALQNAGFRRFTTDQRGVNLTVDLCPSKAPLDRFLFSAIIKEFRQIVKPVPVALALSGLWMENHVADLEWLRSLEREGKISILWINHSYNHRVKRKTPLRKNFLLSGDTVIDEEILKTEKKMLESGIIPSVFFRFPGLVSDPRLFYQVTAFGLIPVGSDAWLGKKQWPREGSIVLVHANGHEPVGLKRFMHLLNINRRKIRDGRWSLYDLRESMVDFEKRKNPGMRRGPSRTTAFDMDALNDKG